jgi:predicted transcriptional regulator
MSLATERHYTIAEVAEMWSFSERTIRRILDGEAGILVIGHPGDGRRRRFQTVRIPESVLHRIHNRLTNPSAALPRRWSARAANKVTKALMPKS